MGKNERTVIRASTGIFYDPTQTDQYRRALLNSGSPAFFTGTNYLRRTRGAHAIDDAPEQNNIDSGTTVTLSDASDRRRDRGNTLTDRRHVLNLTGIFAPQFRGSGKLGKYQLNLNRVSVALIATSGDVFNIGSNRILNGDSSESSANQRPLLLGRNTVRGPAIFELNARYSRIFPLSEQKNLEFIAESTNITNTLNVTNLSTTAQVDTFGTMLVAPLNAATAARDQRLIQLGVRFNF